jgi:hypothetical protein
MLRTRRLLVAIVVAVSGALVLPASADARHGNVAGTMTGPGEFVPGVCNANGIILVRGRGTFTATGLGSGTYRYDVCVMSVSPITFDGTASVTTSRGTLSGTVAGTFVSGVGPQFPVTIDAGTGKYRKTRGTLLLGPLQQTDLRNCDPRVGICLAWTDVGPITGTLTHVPHP